MTPLKLLVTLGALAATSHAMAWDYVLLDTCLLYTSDAADE